MQFTRSAELNMRQETYFESDCMCFDLKHNGTEGPKGLHMKTTCNQTAQKQLSTLPVQPFYCRYESGGLRDSQNTASAGFLDCSRSDIYSFTSYHCYERSGYPSYVKQKVSSIPPVIQTSIFFSIHNLHFLS